MPQNTISIACEGADLVDIELLQEIQGELKTLASEDYDKLKSSLLKYGYSFPAFVWKDNDTYWTLDAHQRNKVCKTEGFSFKQKNGKINKKIPVAYIHAESRVEAKEKLLMLNSRFGQMTNEGLYGFLTEEGFEIDFSNIEDIITLPDIDLGEFNSEFLEHDPIDLNVNEDVFEEVPPEEPVTSRGDLYEFNGHRLLCGDSTSQEDVTRLMNGQKAAMLYTDPPYNVNYAEFNQSARPGRNWTNEYCSEWQDSMTDADYTQFLIDFIKNAKDNMIEFAHYYVWYASTYQTEVIAAFKSNDITIDKVPIIWNKQRAPIAWVRYKRKYEPCIFGGKHANSTSESARWFGPNNEVNVWDIPVDHNSTYVHPTQKPVALAARAITNSSQQNEIVLDLFMGSGTTFIASDKLGRTAYGMEYEPKFCDVIVKRYIKYCEDNNKPYEIKLNGNIINKEYFDNAD